MYTHSNNGNNNNNNDNRIIMNNVAGLVWLKIENS